MTATTLSIMHWIAYALLVGSAIAIGLSIPQFHKARRAPYYVLRRDALKLATRWMAVALAMLVVAAIILFAAPRLVAVVSAPSPPSTATSVPTLTLHPTRTPTPSAMLRASATPTRRPTATPPVIPTSTSPVPTPEARIEFKALSTEVRGGQPVDPGSVFPPGDHRVYVFFRYQGMQDGMETTVNWYKNGEEIDFCSDMWLWGQDEDYAFGGTAGASLVFCKPPGGWEPGYCEVHILIKDQPQFIAEFEIVEE